MHPITPSLKFLEINAGKLVTIAHRVLQKWQHMRRKRGPSQSFVFWKTIFVYFIPKY